jgi:hypothetical protein
MTPIKWNLFAEGAVEDIKELPKIDSADKVIYFILKECKVCKQMVWIKHPFIVCSNCIP